MNGIIAIEALETFAAALVRAPAGITGMSAFITISITRRVGTISAICPGIESLSPARADAISTLAVSGTRPAREAM
jgi:hypothetical protein